MIHIATVHWRSDRWIDIQLRYLERNLDEPYRVYAWLDEEIRDQAHKFFYATDVPVEQHELKLTLLGDLVAHAAERRRDDHVHRRRRLPDRPDRPLPAREARALPAGRDSARREQRRPPAPSLVLRHHGRAMAASLPGRLAARAHLDQPSGQGGHRRGRQPARPARGRAGSTGTRCFARTRSIRTRSSSASTRISSTTTAAASGSPRAGRLWRASVEDRLNATLRGRLAARLPRTGSAAGSASASTRCAATARRSARELATGQRAGLRPDPARRGVLPPADRARSAAAS